MKHIRKLRILYFKLRRPFFSVRVTGESMWPELVAGKRYLGTSCGMIRAGDYALFRHPISPGKILIKRVEAVSGDFYKMASLVSWGSSSADFGDIPRLLILGKIIR